jgi:hypothetical protein
MKEVFSKLAEMGYPTLTQADYETMPEWLILDIEQHAQSLLIEGVPEDVYGEMVDDYIAIFKSAGVYS